MIPGLLIIFHLLILGNIQFTAWPEILSFPYLKNNGFDLYRDFVHAYPPLLTIILATLYKYLGYRMIVIKGFTWVLILINDVLIFKITQKLTSSKYIALLALLFYVLTQPFLEGNMLWFDTALTTPLLATLYTLLFPNLLVLSGYFMALALLTKQTAILYLPIFSLLLLVSSKKIGNFARFLAAPIILCGVLALKLFSASNLEHFLNWTLIYPSKYWTKFPGYVDLDLTIKDLSTLAVLFAPTFSLLVYSKTRQKYLLITLFTIAGIVGVYPRFSYFHLQPAIAFAAIGSSLSFINLKKYKYLPIIYSLTLIFLIAIPALKQNFGKPTRFYGNEETLFTSALKSQVSRGDTIYLLGPHSGYYVFTETLPPKPWLDNFGWYWEMSGEAEKALAKWSETPPSAIVVDTKSPGDWYDLGAYQSGTLVNWIEENYTKGEELDDKSTLWTKNN